LSFAVLLVLALLAFAASGCGGDSSSESGSGSSGSSQGDDSTSDKGSGGSGDCADGVPIVADEVDGVKVSRFCGDASATVTVDGKDYQLTGGNCAQVTDKSFAISIGLAPSTAGGPEEDKEKFDFLSVVGGTTELATADTEPITKDGSYEDDGIVINTSVGGAASLVGTGAKLTLTDDRTKGTFEGAAIGGAKVSGSFDCG